MSGFSSRPPSPIARARLQFVSSTQVKFAPAQGDAYVRINGIIYPIPSAGVTGGNTGVFVNGVAGQNLVANTDYWLYLFANAGVLTCDYCTTGHSTDTTAGNVGTEIKTGDASRSLIGRVRTNASAQFSALLVASFFNRQWKATSALVTNTSTASTTFVTFAADAVAAVAWADDPIFVGFASYAYNSLANDYGILQIVDQNAAIYVQETCFAQSLTNQNPASYLLPFSVAEGFYSLTLKAESQAAGNTFSIANMTMYLMVRG